jgi:hypothetical protein
MTYTPRMRKLWAAVGVVAVLAACSSEGSSTPSKAFCADLRDGLTVMNLRGSQDPKDYASDVYGRVSISCPEMFQRTDVRALMEAWNLPTS